MTGAESAAAANDQGPSPQEVVDAMWAGDDAPKLLGMTVVSVGVDCAVLSLTVDERHRNGHGMGHGGVTFSLADTAMAYASNGGNEMNVATHAEIDFLAPADVGATLVATAELAARSGRTSVWNVTVTDGDTVVSLMRGRTRALGRPVVPEP